MSIDRAAILNGLVSRPWEREGLHCWAFVVEVQQVLFGRTLPLVTGTVPSLREKLRLFAEHGERDRWREVEEPRDGAIVLMRRAGREGARDGHAGVYLDVEGPGCVWHVDAPHGVEAVGLAELIHVRRWAPTFYEPRA